MIHLALSMSAAGSLRQALPQGTVVFGLPNRMNAGPITDPCGDDFFAFQQMIDQANPIAAWEEEGMGREARKCIREFWQAALADQERTLWYSSCSAPDICAVAVVLRDSQSIAKLRLIDVDTHFDDSHVTSVGEIAPQQLAPLVGTAVSPDAGQLRHMVGNLAFATRYADLPLRWWVARDTIAPVPWTLVDGAILASFRDHKSLSAARLVGETLGILSREANNVDDGIVWYRLCKLIEGHHLDIVEPDDALTSGSLIAVDGTIQSERSIKAG
ncbi:DUF3658 domain-containing protein [Erythrobacter aureus]|nr:DUF3658 domain-containing protein [Erythrobacter aureus]